MPKTGAGRLIHVATVAGTATNSPRAKPTVDGNVPWEWGRAKANRSATGGRPMGSEGLAFAAQNFLGYRLAAGATFCNSRTSRPEAGSDGGQSRPGAQQRQGLFRDNQDENAHCLTRNAPLAEGVASSEMLPTGIAFEEHWDEEDEHGGARRTGHRAGTKVRGLHPSGEDSDSGRVRGRHGLSPKARDARPAHGRDPATRGRKGGPAHLRRRGRRRAGGALGGIGPDLRQALEGADADPGGGDGAARPPEARAGPPHRAAGHERRDGRQVVAQGPGAGRRRRRRCA